MERFCAGARGELWAAPHDDSNATAPGTHQVAANPPTTDLTVVIRDVPLKLESLFASMPNFAAPSGRSQELLAAA
jgi:hypothetical protein